MAKIKRIEKGNVALCSACNKLSAAALDCECTSGMPTQAARNKFRKTFPRHEHDVAALVADLEKAREELEVADGALVMQRDAIQSAVDGENEARARLAALEARAADEAVNADFILDLIDNPPAPTPAMVALFANAPAAPAKACENPMCVAALDCVGHDDAPSPLAAQLAEAVELLREAAPDSWWTPNRDDWRARRAALLDAIDAGRARAT